MNQRYLMSHHTSYNTALKPFILMFRLIFCAHDWKDF